MKRWNFGGLRASHGVSISHRSHGSTGGRQDPGKTFKNKKMAGHLGVDRVTTLNLKVVQTDVERGLILVEGAVPGRQGRLDHGARRGEEEAAGRRAEAGQVPPVGQRSRGGGAARRGRGGGASAGARGRDMELKVTTLDGKEAGSVELSDAIFGLEPRTDLIQRCIVWQLARAPARHPQGQEPGRDQPHRQEDLPAEGHRRRPPRLRAAPTCSAAAAARSGRWCAATPSTCPRRCARSRSGTRSPPRPRTAASSCSTA